MAKFRYQHIKSSVEGKAPTAAQIKVAEIGVNDFAGDEKLFIKNSEGEVVDFPRGYSREYIDDNERVVSEALIDLNERKLDVSAYTPTDLSDYYTKEEIDEFEETTAASLNDLEDRKADKNEFDEQFETIAASLNDLEDRKANKSDIGNMEEVIAAALNYLEETKANEADLEEIGETTAYALNDLECRKADKNEFDDQFEAIAASLNDLEDRKANKSDIDDTERVIAESLVDLNERKLDASAYTPTDLTNYYTKSETSGATEIATALSGKSDTGHTHSEYATKVGDLDSIKLKKITQSAYDALVQAGTVDPDTLYIITD